MRVLRGFLTMAVFCMAFAPCAQADVVAMGAPSLPTLVTVGQTAAPGIIELRNANTGTDASRPNLVCNFQGPAPCNADAGISLVPSCGLLDSALACAVAGADAGVFRLSATAEGEAGSACDGVLFDVAPAASGAWRFTPRAPVKNVTLPATAAICRIDFTFDVLRTPAIDQAPLPGIQTIQTLDNTQYRLGAPSTALGRGAGLGVTVQRATPAIAATASPGVAVGPGRLTDTAVVTGLVNPQPGGTVSFRLYAPGDTLCARRPVFQPPPAAYPTGGGSLRSAPFSPPKAGFYRWRAFYDGDANNAPVATVCNIVKQGATAVAPTPVLGVPELSPARFRAAAKGQSIVARGGGKVRYTLSEPASVTFSIERVVTGRRIGTKCVETKRAKSDAKRCSHREALRGSFTHSGRKGVNTFRFSGRLRARTLEPGSYRLRAAASTPAGGKSRVQRGRFRVVAPKQQR